VKKVIFAAALAAMMSSAFAAPDATPKVLDIPVKQGGMKIVNKFPAVGKMQGWVLQRGGQNSVVFTTPDGKYLFAGALIDENGNNLTEDYTAKYVPKPDFTKLYSQLESSAYFIEGAKGSAVKGTIYAFMDPNCSYCHLAWKALQPYESAGLQVRWIPVGFLTHDSLPKAAALLESADPGAAMAQHEATFDPSTETGGIKPVEKISPATAKKLQANAKLMSDFGFGGTPAIVYKDKNGKVVGKPGMPRLSELPEMTGMPEQPQTDPELARFR